MFGTANSDPDITSDLTHTEIRTSTEYVFANGTVTLGPSMPSPTEDPGFGNTDHCMVGLIGGDVMIIRRSSISPHAARVYRYNPSTNIYTRQEKAFQNALPPNNNADHYAACSSFYSAKHGNRHVVYLGGGYSSGLDAQLFDYTMTNAEWEVRKFVTHTYCSHINITHS